MHFCLLKVRSDTLDASRRGPGVHCFTDLRPYMIGAIVVLPAWQQMNGRVGPSLGRQGGLQGNVMNLREAETAGNESLRGEYALVGPPGTEII
jgi:hypothetical protein